MFFFLKEKLDLAHYPKKHFFVFLFNFEIFTNNVHALRNGSFEKQELADRLSRSLTPPVHLN